MEQNVKQSTTIFETMLGTIDKVRKRKPISPVKGSIQEDCRNLVLRGADTSKRLAENVLARYPSLSKEEKISFFKFLADELDIDVDVHSKFVAAYKEVPSAANLKKLMTSSTPRRQKLLSALNSVPKATADLVEMRAELLTHIFDNPDLKRVDLDFETLFHSWFNRGFLKLENISWDSPASVLAKIIVYEAVHEINGWGDLRSRIHPTDRRCYAFCHPMMEGEPLVFTEVGLVKGTPNSIQAILEPDRKEIAAHEADTAVFYSISNCQKGLRGISFGNLLIKQVVADLKTELPNIKKFVTLSPLPGFSSWLSQEGLDAQNDDVLKEQAAYYLADAKRSNGMPLDPVARFHLSNGAKVFALHSNADTSSNGLFQSRGVMVNYLYDLETIEANQELYGSTSEIVVSDEVNSLRKSFKKRQKLN